MKTVLSAGMADAPRTRGARALLPAVGLAAVAVVLVLVATRHGPGASTDSVFYVAAARSLIAGRGFVDTAGATLTIWPPGLSSVLAVGIELGLSVGTTVRVVNALSIAAIVLLAYVLFDRHLRSRTGVLVGTTLVALSPTILRVADMIWSEALFCALLLGFVVVFESAVRDGSRQERWLVAAAVVVWGAALVRWVGFALVPAGVVALVATRPRASLRRILSFAALGSVVPALWLLRNVTTGDSATGQRATNDRFDAGGVRTVLRGIGRLALPDRVPDGITEVAGLLLVAVLVATVVVVVRKGNTADGTDGWPLTTLVSVVAWSSGFLLASFLFADTDWNARILAPVYAPALVIGFVLYERLRDGFPHWLSTVVVVVFSLWLTMVGVWAVALAWDHGRAARGYASSTWTDSELAAATRATDPGVPIYSNVPVGIAAVTDRYPVRSIQVLRGCRGDGLLALFGDVQPDDLDLTVETTPVGSYRDGSLWRVDCGA